MIPSMLAAVRNEWRRGFALAFALWFAALSVDLPMLHTCPMHGAGVAASATHGGHGLHASDADDTNGSSRAPTHSSGCTCLGQCCASAPTTLPATTLHAAIDSRVVESALIAIARFDAPTTWSGFALPFATAPPQG